MTGPALLLGLALSVQGPATAPPDEFVAAVRVHGNYTTPDADITALAGLAVGERLTPGLLDAIEARLRASGRFAGVEVRKRHSSISDPTAILIVIVVDERASTTLDDPVPGPMRRIIGAGMWLPILRYEEGHGFTYGARMGVVNVLGSSSRVSVPLTWGGERQAALNVERAFTSAPISRIVAGAGIHHRENVFYESGDTRREVHVRAERAFTNSLRAGMAGNVEHVSFGEPDPSSNWNADARQWSAGFDVTLDTRLDPTFARNAVFVTGGWQHFEIEQQSISRWSGAGEGYVGVVGGAVLTLRAHTQQADLALPPWEQALLGGSGTLRGYRAGWRAGDNLATVTSELNIPLTSPLSVGRFGVRAFVDAGTTWMAGETLRRSRWDRGIGGGVFLGFTLLNASLDVAWPESGGPRWHIGLGVTF